MRLKTVEQIKKDIEKHKKAIEVAELDLVIAARRKEIAEFEAKKKSILHPKRKYTRRKKAEKLPYTLPEPQTPTEPTQTQPQAPAKPKRGRRTKAQIEADKKAAENPEPLYRCLNPNCKTKGKPFPKSEIKVKDRDSFAVQCPICLVWDVVPYED